MRVATSISRMHADFLLCHPERSEGPMQLAEGEAPPANYIDPSRRERAQDDKRVFVEICE
jgi:hypothetical protein